MRAIFLSLFLATPAASEPIPLTAPEIRELLTGNTVLGHWVDHNYRQYFPAYGTTYYAPEHGRSSRGRWRVNDRTGEYESEWNESGHWEGYGITREDGQLYWVSDGLPPQPFQMLAGDQLVWPQN